MIRQVYLMFLIAILGVLPENLYSQTFASGKVVDKLGTPIEGVWVGFKGSSIYNSTDAYGFFELSSSKSFESIEIFRSGYNDAKVAINKSVTTDLIITLEESNLLKEVVITRGTRKKKLRKKENPAYNILKEVWKNKKTNGLDLEDIYEYQKFSSLESGSIFPKKFFNKKKSARLKPKSKILIQNKDSTEYKIPINLKETMKEYYVNNLIGKKRVITKYDRDLRAFDTYIFFFEQIENIFNYLDIYKNSLQIMNDLFESPISRNGFSVYDYTLADSLTIDNRKYYTINFYPLNTKSLAFKGSFTVVAPSYSISDIYMTTLKDLNANLIKNIQIEKSFTIKNDSVYFPKTDFSKMSLSISRESEIFDLYVTKVEQFRNYVFDKPKPDIFYKEPPKKNKKKIENNTLSLKAKESFIDSREIIERQKNIDAIKTLKANKKVQFGFSVANTLSTGFIPVTKTLQLGSIFGFYDYNTIEGNKYIIQARTFKNLNDHFKTHIYYAYGEKNKRSNFGIFPSYLIDVKPEIRLRAFYFDDLKQSLDGLYGPRETLFSPSSPGLIILRPSGFISKMKSFGFGTQLAFSDNFRLWVSLYKADISSSNESLFDVSYFDGNENVRDFNITPMKVSLRYSPRRNVLGKGVEQGVSANLYGTFRLSYTRSIKNFLDSQISFSNLSLYISYPFRLNRFGVLNYYLNAGKTFGVLPVSLLKSTSSGRGLISGTGSFNSLNPYDFIMDEYIFTGFEHHFNGYILNKIPLINKLRFRALVFFNSIYGDVSKENISANRSSIVYNTPKPYYEYGFGIENIGIGTLRLLSIRFGWRGDLADSFVRNNPDVINPRFTFRLGIRTTLF